jgi:hypothetical protein
MTSLRHFRTIFGWRNPRLAEQPSDVALLRSLYSSPLPDDLLGFLESLADCVLYYQIQVPGVRGGLKTYSHFVLTNIGPDLASPSPFPSSLINRIKSWRAMGLPADIVPIMSTAGGGGRWLFCQLQENSSPVLIAKGDREFGCSSKEWNEIASDFSSFVDRLTFDVSPLLSGFRLVGTSQVDDSMRALLTAAMGSDWESQIAQRL